MAVQSKAPNTRNHKQMEALAAAAQIASSKEFLQLKSRETQALYAVYTAAVDSGQTPEEVMAGLAETLVTDIGVAPEGAAGMAEIAYRQFSSGAFENTVLTPPALKITLEDYRKVAELCQVLPKKEFTVGARLLLLALISVYRFNTHPSNWIRYDRKNIFYLAGIHKKPAEIQEALTQYLHAHCGLQMRVVGSNHPIVCYDFPWIHEQPTAGEPQNPYLTLGTLTPEALKTVLDKIENSPEVVLPLIPEEN